MCVILNKDVKIYFYIKNNLVNCFAFLMTADHCAPPNFERTLFDQTTPSPRFLDVSRPTFWNCQDFLNCWEWLFIFCLLSWDFKNLDFQLRLGLANQYWSRVSRRIETTRLNVNTNKFWESVKTIILEEASKSGKRQWLLYKQVFDSVNIK
jgi:hypothetical protein